MLFISVVLLISSLFGLSFIIEKSNLNWWKYLSTVNLAIGLITITLSKFISKERKKLLIILDFMSLILLLTAFILAFL
jgi:hypothetical protein